MSSQGLIYYSYADFVDDATAGAGVYTPTRVFGESEGAAYNQATTCEEMTEMEGSCEDVLVAGTEFSVLWF